MQEDRLKHLEFIQAVITRMAYNSFLLKGWSVTLAAAFFALAAKDANINFIIIALFPAISFWILDAFYLRQERLFRKHYDYIRNIDDNNVDAIDPFSMNTSNYKSEVKSWFRTLWSSTIILLHGVIIIVIVAVLLYNFLC